MTRARRAALLGLMGSSAPSRSGQADTREALDMPPPAPDLDQRDGPRDECGVFGIYAPGHDVSRLAYFALYALQHRGQESAGIAAAERDGSIMAVRELGLVSQVFDEQKLRALGASWRSGMCATRPRAPRRSRMLSPCTAPGGASSRWATTAT